MKKGREVELTINGEVKKVQVPELTNYAQDDAINVLKSYNLAFKSETVADDNIEIGKVVSTDPPANTEVSEGTVITLKVSKGPAKKKVDVPDGLKGDLIYNVTAKLENAGLVVGTITKDDSSTLPADTVISTSPDSGTKVSEGATVDILVSSGKGAVKDLHYSVPLPGDYDRDILLQVYCNGTLVESSTVNPAYSGTYSLLFSGTSGSDTIVIQLDGQKYMELEFNYDSQQVHAGETLGYTPPGDVEPDVSGSGDVTPE